ncbi:MAG: hypothetical protein WDN24_07545 [Sphingomonas sp.]
MIVSLFLAALLGAPMPQETPPQRIRNVILFGEEQCPTAENPDEIVVCAKSGESPYRIPKEFRNAPSDDPAAVSWSRRAELIEEVNRVGLPNSCGVTGMSGQTGCSRELIRQWAQERLEKRVKEADVP